jgi:neutral trehalase
LERAPLGRSAAYRRLIKLPTGEIVYRFYDDSQINYDTKEGLRFEAEAEDTEEAERVVFGLEGEEKKRRWEKFVLDKLAACESLMDFAPGWQSADYRTLEQIRTTDIAPVFLQANMVHMLRLAGRREEADALAVTINKHMWRDIDDTHGQYCDLLHDGTQTMALNAAMAYPLMAGGIVPYDRAVKVANTWKDKLSRRYGFIISNANSKQQWDGDPDEEEDRGWPSINMWLAECFTQAAIEAKANGHDPEPLIEAAEIARCAAEGIDEWFKTHRTVAEKLNSSHPIRFVNGGEYGKTLEDVQIGFGMSIGAYRKLTRRNFRGEVKDPREYSWRQYTINHTLGGLAVASAA